MLEIPKVPENLRYNRQNLTLVTSDVFNICERIKEIDKNLIVRLRDNHEKPWVVMELGADGEERYVAAYEELDQRILEDLRYMLAVPFEQRLAAEAKKADEHNARLGHMSDEKMDRLAWDFQKAMVESNMVNPKWSKNMPLRKRG